MRAADAVLLSGLALLFLFAVPPGAAAQTEGRVGVGASVTWVGPVDDNVKKTVSVGPVLRLNPRRGWGLAGAFNWFRADLRQPGVPGEEFATLRVRPLMAGVGYTVGAERTLVTFSLVAGPSFNSARFEEAFLQGRGGSPAIDAENSVAVRPGVGFTYSVARRVGITGFAGYMINRPDILYRDPAGREVRDEWRADAIVLSAGVVYSLF